MLFEESFLLLLDFLCPREKRLYRERKFVEFLKEGVYKNRSLSDELFVDHLILLQHLFIEFFEYISKIC